MKIVPCSSSKARQLASSSAGVLIEALPRRASIKCYRAYPCRLPSEPWMRLCFHLRHGADNVDLSTALPHRLRYLIGTESTGSPARIRDRRRRFPRRTQDPLGSYPTNRRSGDCAILCRHSCCGLEHTRAECVVDDSTPECLVANPRRGRHSILGRSI